MKSQWGGSDSSYQLLHTNVPSFPAVWTFPSLIKKGLMFFFFFSNMDMYIYKNQFVWAGKL